MSQEPVMYPVPLAAIVVAEDRIRREFDATKLGELEESIFLSGQLQPGVIDEDKNLIIGERRYKALTKLHARYKQGELNLELCENPVARAQIQQGVMFITLRADLVGEAALEAELAENLRRSDLTWQETTAAVKKLHELRVEQKGEYNPGTKEGQSKRDTAKEIVGDGATTNDVSKITDSLLLSDFLDDPLVAAAASETEALKMIRDIEKAKDLAHRADNFDLSKSPHQCWNMDAYEWMEKVEFPPADVVITDPPYGRNMHKQGMSNEHKYDDSREAWDIWCDRMPDLLFSRTAQKAHVYVFFDTLNWDQIMTAMIVAGFDVWKRPLIWDKGHIGSYGKIEVGPRHCYDGILYANKGNREVVTHNTDVIKLPQDTGLPHPASKPPSVLLDLLKRSIRPGDTVIDPMVGGGTLFQAATDAQATAYANEGKEEYFHMALEAINQSIV
jgi:DNA modification methylase